MVRIEQLAEAALNQDSLLLRSLTPDFLHEHPNLRTCPRPITSDLKILAAAASLIELLAQRSHQEPPPWTNEIGASRTNLFGERGCNHETLEGIVRERSSRTVAQTRVLRAA